MFLEICQLIEDLTGFQQGTKLQVGHLLQNAPQRWVLVQEAGGVTYFYPNEDMIDCVIQILCRAPNYMDAREDAYTLYHALHGTSSWNCPRIVSSGPDYLAMTVEAVYAPQYLGEDEDRRHVFSTNYIFRMEEGSCLEPTSGSLP